MCLAVMVMTGQGCAPPEDAAAPSSSHTDTENPPPFSLEPPSHSMVEENPPQSPGPLTPPTEQQGLRPPTAAEPTTPDWSLRYRELVSQYAARFQAPPLGQSVDIQLASGRRITGVLTELTESELTLTLPNGSVSYPMQSLSADSAQRFFLGAYAARHARQQALREYHAWNSRQTPADPAAQQDPPQRDPDPDPGTPPEASQEDRMFPIPPELLRN